jgi:hypothetical protein
MPNPIYFDRRKQVSTSTGQGAFTLNPVVGPWKALNTTPSTLAIPYCIAHQTASDWEVGLGSVDNLSQTLTRSTVFDGSAGAGNLTNFSGGNKDVFITPLANYMPRVNPWTCHGRLGLQSGSPTTDVTSSSTVYFTPFQGTQVAMPETASMGAGQWKLYDFTEISTPISGQIANIPFDVSLVDTNGVLGLSTQQWASATARSVAITFVDGIPLIGNYRYLGTINPVTATTTADYPKQRFVWNYYNSIPRRMGNFPATGTWSGVGNLAWRGQNTDTTKARAVEFVIGLTPPLRPVNVRAAIYYNTPAGTFPELGLTLDASSANWTPSLTDAFTVEGGGNQSGFMTAEYNQIPPIGYHYLQPTEAIQVGTGTVGWYDYYANRFVGGVQGTIWA